MGSSTTSLYRRPTSSLALPLDHWPANTACSLASSCSEQVHLAIGAPGEMLVLFATHDDTTPSEVTWWASDDAGDVKKATGTASAYTQLLWLEPNLVTPPLGQPTATMTELLDLQNTASWAFDPTTGERYGFYLNSTSVHWGLSDYRNPDVFYNSPLLHTVRLAGLRGGATYTYRVAGDSRAFSFAMPPDADGGAFPLTLGLTADLGQTAVSEANAARLLADVAARRAGRGGAARGGPRVRRRLPPPMGLLRADGRATHGARARPRDGRQPRGGLRRVVAELQRALPDAAPRVRLAL